MDVQQLIMYLLVYLIPGITLFGCACLVVTRNYRNTTNRLIALLIYLYSFIFLEEFIRHLLPIAYSPLMVELFLKNTSVLIICVTLHFFLHITKLDERIMIPFYPVSGYLPAIFMLLTTFFNIDLVSHAPFIQRGIWYVPVYTLHYYLLLIIFTIILLIFIAILVNGITSTATTSRKKILRLLASGTFIGLITVNILAYPNPNDMLPPYPYLIMGIIFPLLLMIAAYRFNMLPSDATKYRMMFNLMPASITVVNSDWDIVELNGYAKKELIQYEQQGTNLFGFVRSLENKEALSSFIQQLEEHETLNDYPITFITNDIGLLHYSIEASTIVLEDQKLFYLIWRNVTEELENDRLIEQMAYHDGLTTLHNRAYFVSNVKKRIAKLAVSSTSDSALVLIDLNRFKQINDTYGHAVGDQVLQHTAILLKQAVRTNDLVARLGGDEFVIFLENFPTQKAVFDWYERLQNTFQHNPFQNETVTLQVEASIGIAFYPTDADTFESLFQLADANMYTHKRNSRKKDD